MSNLSPFLKIKSDFIKRKIWSKLQNKKKMEMQKNSSNNWLKYIKL